MFFAGLGVYPFVLAILDEYPFLRVLPLAVSLLQRVTFSKRRKGNPKGFAPAYGTSLRLSVPSLRCPSGGIAYGLLRCTSSRCMRLRRTVAALPPPDQSLHSACRRALRSKALLELTLIVLSGAASPHGVCTNKIVGAGLPAMAA